MWAVELSKVVPWELDVCGLNVFAFGVLTMASKLPDVACLLPTSGAK